MDDLIRHHVRKRVKKSGGTAYTDTVSAVNSMTDQMLHLRTADSNLPTPGTDGSINTLIRDVTGLVESTLNTIVDTVVFADNVISLPSNLGKAYNEPIAQQNFTF